LFIFNRISADNTLNQGLQTTAGGPNQARNVISFGRKDILSKMKK